MAEITFYTFRINNLFDESVNKFDLDEAPARKAKNIKVLFREVSKDNHHKAIVIVQDKEEVIGKHFQENFDKFKIMAQI